jgi:hypothetical protein
VPWAARWLLKAGGNARHHKVSRTRLNNNMSY